MLDTLNGVIVSEVSCFFSLNVDSQIHVLAWPIFRKDNLIYGTTLVVLPLMIETAIS